KRALLMPIDRGSILMVVYLAFSESVTEGLWHTISVRDLVVVVLLDILILAIVLAVTMFGSRWAGFSKADEIAITFCGSKKSLASGVPIATVLFAGQSIGSIMLPLMLFHQIQLMVCAVIAQKYAAAARKVTAGETPSAAQ
ncbi:MAG: bile acid:sodium symporter, partial [Phyllobacterium sp.]